MRDAAIALHRYGLGGKGDVAPPSDPKRWLLDQIAQYEPAPPAIAAQLHSRVVVDMLRDRRELQRDKKQAEMKPGGGDDQLDVTRLMELQKQVRDVYVQAVGARTDLALSTTTPFAERLVHFWANHFAISVDKIVTTGLAGSFEFEAIRPHVMGKFSAMLGAVERHPAMLLYLDQAQSIGPGSPLAQRAARRAKEIGLNENLAREILELHTLGVRSGYSQTDVTELARALTGWTVGGIARQRYLQGPGPGFWFAGIIHEPGDRKLLGKTYPQSGEAQAQAMLNDLAIHPATARHIATKLARHFAADDPPPALVARLEQVFLSSGGDLPALYRVLIDAPEVWTGKPKFRTPWEWAIAALRATGVSKLPGASAAGAFQQLGQPIWKPGSPAGYDDTASSWAGPDALYRRVEVAQRLAQRTAPAIDARQLAARLFPGALSQTTSDALSRAESGEQALALLLSSPEMLRR